MEKFNLKAFSGQAIADGAEDVDQEYIEYLNRLADTDIECHLDHDPFPSPPPEIQFFLEEILDAQINIENQEKALVAQRAKLMAARRALNAHVIRKDSVKLGRGKPKENAAMQEAAKRFTAMWVKSVLIQLGAKNSADLEKFILGSDERNWRRWGNGGAVPTSRLLISIITTNISKGNHKGRCLVDIQTSPPSRKLLDLINLLRRVGI